MAHQITITVSDEVYRGLRSVARDRTISEVIEDLARPIVAVSALDASYREMSLDQDREREAMEWAEGLIQDSLPSRGHVPR